VWRCLGLLLVVAVAGCGTVPAPRAERVSETITSQQYGFTARLPAGWTSASESLTPGLSNPVEILSAGTFGDMRPRDGACAQMPGGGLERIGPEDAFLTIQERYGEPVFPDRPASFALEGKSENSDAATCAGKEKQLDVYWFGFRDAGRGFHVLVALGRSASPARVAEALALLDSLRFEPGPAGVHLDPDLAIHFEDRSARLSWSTVPPWRRYEWPLTSVDAERLVLGTFELQRSAPDENCTPRAAIDALPPDGAFIYVFEYDHVQPSSLASFPARTGELELGPRQEYECVGDSQMVRWRDHGRAFQAHLYVGSRASDELKRDAISILNSIQAR
jgi:hypothetical protein